MPYFTMHKLYPSARENMLIVIAPMTGMLPTAEDEVAHRPAHRAQGGQQQTGRFRHVHRGADDRGFPPHHRHVALVMVILSSIGLLVGGIGVMNIMLVSVTERTREIGIRKAVGARRSDIIVQFLTEAVVLTGIGGIIGLFLGWCVSSWSRLIFQNLPTAVPLWAALSGILVSVGVGLFFGIWPAGRAANLDPVVALRYERGAVPLLWGGQSCPQPPFQAAIWAGLSSPALTPQSPHFALRQMPPLPDLQIADAHRPNRHPHQFDHLAAHGLHHAPHLPVAPLPNRQFDMRIFAGIAQPLRQRRARGAVAQLHPAAQTRDLIVAQPVRALRLVGLRNFVLRIRQPLAKLRVVRHDQQARRVQVQPPHRDQPRARVLHQVVHRGPALRIGVTWSDNPWAYRAAGRSSWRRAPVFHPA